MPTGSEAAGEGVSTVKLGEEPPEPVDAPVTVRLVELLEIAAARLSSPEKTATMFEYVPTPRLDSLQEDEAETCC